MNSHIRKAGRAIAEAREKYTLGPVPFNTKGKYCVYLADEHGLVADDARTHCFTGTRAECQAWIDEQSARAAFESVLPVGDDVEESAVAAIDSEVIGYGCRVIITAAIHAILGRGK